MSGKQVLDKGKWYGILYSGSGLDLCLVSGPFESVGENLRSPLF
jgi:hypothetical protein